MNCDVEVPKRPSPTPIDQTKAAAAIDEALNGLSSESESENEEQKVQTPPAKSATERKGEPANKTTDNVENEGLPTPATNRTENDGSSNRKV